MLIRDGRLLVTPTPELIRHLYEEGYTEDEFVENLGISTTRKKHRVIDILKRYFGEEGYQSSRRRRKENQQKKWKGL